MPWVIKQFCDRLEEEVDDMTREEGYAACSSIFPGLQVKEVMDLVRVHGHGVPELTPLKPLSRAQGQGLMEKIRAKVAGKRSADQVSNTSFQLFMHTLSAANCLCHVCFNLIFSRPAAQILLSDAFAHEFTFWHLMCMPLSTGLV